jgi:tRNA G26 N,N-dimethylase Trm1
LHDICKTVHCTPPKAAVFRSALINAGYRVSGSHANPLAVKTGELRALFLCLTAGPAVSATML